LLLACYDRLIRLLCSEQKIKGLPLFYSKEIVAVTILASALTGCEPSARDSTAPDVEGGIGAQTANSLATLSYASNTVTHHDAAGRVKVDVSSAWSEDGLLVIRGIFTPDDAGYHLYSSALAKTGVGGIGRPTLIEVSDVALIQEIGPLVSSEKAVDHHDDVLDMTFPIYPDGPVTVYLPLRLNSAPKTPTQIPVKITYMSCSKANCNVPIEGDVAEITVPAPEGAALER